MSEPELLLARLRDLRHRAAARPPGAVRRHPHRCRAERDRRAGDALLPAGARLPARPRVLPADRHPAADLPGAGPARARVRRGDRGRACAAGHDRRRLQQHPLRRRGDAPSVLAQPDRPLRARMAERMRRAGTCSTWCAAPTRCARRASLAEARRRQAVVQARTPDRCQRPRARSCARCAVGRARDHRAGAADRRRGSRSCGSSACACAGRTRCWTRSAARRPKPFLHVSGMYPPERGCLAVVWPLAPHPTNKNEIIVWDLALDPGELAGLDAEAIRQRMFTRQDDLPEGVTRLPIKTIHINKSPIVIGNLKTLGDAQAAHWGLDVAQALRHARDRRAAGPSYRASAGPRCSRGPRPSARADVDEDLYGGFVGNDDRRALERLRAHGRRQARHRAPRLRRRAARGTGVPLPRAQLRADALRRPNRRAGRRIAPSACTRAPAAGARSRHSSTGSTHWPRRPTSAGRRFSARCTTTPSRSRPRPPDRRAARPGGRRQWAPSSANPSEAASAARRRFWHPALAVLAGRLQVVPSVQARRRRMRAQQCCAAGLTGENGPPKRACIGPDGPTPSRPCPPPP